MKVRSNSMSLAADFLPACQLVVIVQAVRGWAKGGVGIIRGW